MVDCQGSIPIINSVNHRTQKEALPFDALFAATWLESYDVGHEQLSAFRQAHGDRRMPDNDNQTFGLTTPATQFLQNP